MSAAIQAVPLSALNHAQTHGTARCDCGGMLRWTVDPMHGTLVGTCDRCGDRQRVRQRTAPPVTRSLPARWKRAPLPRGTGAPNGRTCTCGQPCTGVSPRTRQPYGRCEACRRSMSKSATKRYAVWRQQRSADCVRGIVAREAVGVGR